MALNMILQDLLKKTTIQSKSTQKPNHMLDKVEIIALLEKYHKQVCTEPVDFNFIEDTIQEFLVEKEEIINMSYQVDFDFEDL